MDDDLYERDYFLWTEKQVELLKSCSFNKIDLVNLIEEIESLGRSDLRALKSQMVRLLRHLIKWIVQPQRRGSSWELTILNARSEIKSLIAESPSLKYKQLDIFENCFLDAVEEVRIVVEKDNLKIPTKCPWDFDQIVSKGFWPNSF